MLENLHAFCERLYADATTACIVWPKCIPLALSAKDAEGKRFYEVGVFA